MKLPVIVVTAVDARLAGETRQGRVEWSATFVASKTFAVPGLVHCYEKVAIDDLETATTAKC